MAYRSRAYSSEVERKAAASKYDPQKEQEAVEWMEAVVGRGSFPRGTFHEALKDGVYLCELINVLQPGTVKKINSGKMAFKMMENISHFLKGCEAYGLKKTDLFQTADLYEGRNLPQVINTILALARAIQRNNGSRSTSSRSYGSREADQRRYDQQTYDQQSRYYDQRTPAQNYDQRTSAYDYDQQTSAQDYNQETVPAQDIEQQTPAQDIDQQTSTQYNDQQAPAQDIDEGIDDQDPQAQDND